MNRTPDKGIIGVGARNGPTRVWMGKPDDPASETEPHALREEDDRAYGFPSHKIALQWWRNTKVALMETNPKWVRRVDTEFDENLWAMTLAHERPTPAFDPPTFAMHFDTANPRQAWKRLPAACSELTNAKKHVDQFGGFVVLDAPPDEYERDIARIVAAADMPVVAGGPRVFAWDGVVERAREKAVKRERRSRSAER